MINKKFNLYLRINNEMQLTLCVGQIQLTRYSQTSVSSPKRLLLYIYMRFSLFLQRWPSPTLHGNTGARNPIFGYLESAEKWVNGNLNKASLHFWPIFCHI